MKKSNPFRKAGAQKQCFEDSSYLFAANATYLETLYDIFINDPKAVAPGWRTYFKSMPSSEMTQAASHQKICEQLSRHSKEAPPISSKSITFNKQGHVDALVTAFRRFGHLNARLDPLGSVNPPDTRLQLHYHHLTEKDLTQIFDARGLKSLSQASLQDILDALKSVYCGTIGVEYSRITDDTEREWLRQRLEQDLPNSHFDADFKQTILKKLIAAEGLEKYLDGRYPGQKRFSMEGADVLIPMLHALSEQARALDAQELVIGMAHRGRLNVLLNIMGQSPAELFQEFEGTKDYGLTTGDVKYHRGFSSDVKTKSGSIHLSLAFNPSHLEFINPVVLGSVRARQDRLKSGDKIDYAIPVLIHGDAAFTGQGIVMETLSMSQTRAYQVGGAIHIILNNQVGFTTSHVKDARSSRYCSDLAKMIDVPIFHVNGDDVEAVINVVQLALDYRMRFHKDVVIDLVCYRRHGHQEVDEPRATQPMMYHIIDQHLTLKSLYSSQLIKEGVCSQPLIDQWSDRYRDRLEAGREVVDILHGGLSSHYAANWTPFLEQSWRLQVNTAVPIKTLNSLAPKIMALPEGFHLQRNVAALMASRSKMLEGKQLLDWGCAEVLAYATLLNEGYSIRFSGEDSRRGTFFHRHLALFDQTTGECYESLTRLGDSSASMQIYDSLLSEAGALGFEYGYATADPHTLVIWEAQFGDFANSAQVIIDQFISSAWQKWNRLSGLVMLLPHGYEGMGPEHSSARLERYLQLAAQENIQVFVPTTPAQIFHLLRRQVLRPYRKPLIVMTPKSLLRHKLAVSSLKTLSKSQLQLLITEIDNIETSAVKQVIACSGKVYYELLQKRRDHQINSIAIIRIEQLYPFPYEELKAALLSYPKAKELIWCQEEPKNQGAWFCTRHRLVECLPKDWKIRYVGRHSMAAPAGGYPSLHIKQQTDLINRALSIEETL